MTLTSRLDEELHRGATRAREQQQIDRLNGRGHTNDTSVNTNRMAESKMTPKELKEYREYRNWVIGGRAQTTREEQIRQIESDQMRSGEADGGGYRRAL